MIITNVKEEAEQLQQANPESTYKEDAGRGYRKVVPSVYFRASTH